MSTTSTIKMVRMRIGDRSVMHVDEPGFFFRCADVEPSGADVYTQFTRRSPSSKQLTNASAAFLPRLRRDTPARLARLARRAQQIDQKQIGTIIARACDAWPGPGAWRAWSPMVGRQSLSMSRSAPSRQTSEATAIWPASGGLRVARVFKHAGVTGGDSSPAHHSCRPRFFRRPISGLISALSGRRIAAGAPALLIERARARRSRTHAAGAELEQSRAVQPIDVHLFRTMNGSASMSRTSAAVPASSRVAGIEARRAPPPAPVTHLPRHLPRIFARPDRDCNHCEMSLPEKRMPLQTISRSSTRRGRKQRNVQAGAIT